MLIEAPIKKLQRAIPTPPTHPFPTIFNSRYARSILFEAVKKNIKPIKKNRTTLNMDYQHDSRFESFTLKNLLKTLFNKTKKNKTNNKNGINTIEKYIEKLKTEEEPSIYMKYCSYLKNETNMTYNQERSYSIPINCNDFTNKFEETSMMNVNDKQKMEQREMINGKINYVDKHENDKKFNDMINESEHYATRRKKQKKNLNIKSNKISKSRKRSSLNENQNKFRSSLIVLNEKNQKTKYLKKNSSKSLQETKNTVLNDKTYLNSVTSLDKPTNNNALIGGILAYVTTEQTNCGSTHSPWFIKVLKGQKIQLKLINNFFDINYIQIFEKTTKIKLPNGEINHPKSGNDYAKNSSKRLMGEKNNNHYNSNDNNNKTNINGNNDDSVVNLGRVDGCALLVLLQEESAEAEAVKVKLVHN